MPVAGVGDYGVGLLGHTVALQLLQGGVEQRFQVSEVGGVDRDLGREDDLLIVDRGLRVVGLPRRGGPWVRITRGSRSERLITPSGKSDGT